MVIDDERLAALGEGGEFVEIGVLDRLRAVRGFAVPGGPDAVVRIGEDQLAGHRCRQRLLQPGAPPGLPGCPPGGPGRQAREVERIPEKAGARGEDAGVRQRGSASVSGGHHPGQALIQVRVQLAQDRRRPMAGLQVGDVLAVGVVRLIEGPVSDDSQPQRRWRIGGHQRPEQPKLQVITEITGIPILHTPTMAHTSRQNHRRHRTAITRGSNSPSRTRAKPPFCSFTHHIGALALTHRSG
jgi:hypothetical protein